MGIGAMTDKLWEEFYTSMVKMGVFRQGCPIRRLARLEFMNQGPEAYQR